MGHTGRCRGPWAPGPGSERRAALGGAEPGVSSGLEGLCWQSRSPARGQGGIWTWAGLALGLFWPLEPSRGREERGLRDLGNQEADKAHPEGILAMLSAHHRSSAPRM